jgi:hypothetical protein
MPKIERPTTTHVSYTESEIRDLIIRDLAENHNIMAERADVHPLISGGGTHRAIDDSYSGGFNTGDYESAPKAKFDGYVAVGTAMDGDPRAFQNQVERDSHLARILTERE